MALQGDWTNASPPVLLAPGSYGQTIARLDQWLRQLDNAPATIDALPEVVEAVAGRIPVLIDGGIRRGTDIAVALALGADAVLVGRPALWGLAWNGEAGARRALEMLTDELRLALALLGAPDPSALSADHVQRRK